MSIIGISAAVGTTSDFTLTRDQLIKIAHQNIGVLEEGAVLSANQLALGIERIGLIVREIDESGKWQWTIEAAMHLPLASGVSVYDVNNGLPTNIAELMSVSHRTASGVDSGPLTTLSAYSYEQVEDKLEQGDPSAVYLTNDRLLINRKLYVWPTIETVVAQSVITGTDGNAYRCIYPHTGAAVSRPITGANWRMVWELGGLSPATWVSGTSYTMGDHLRISYRRPIYDFDAAGDTPDFPMQWPRLLVLRLQHDLQDVYGIPLAERELTQQKISGAYQDIFASTKKRTNNIHNKARYF